MTDVLKRLYEKNVNYICPKVTKMGSITGHQIHCNGVGVLRGQRRILSKN